MNQWQTSWMSRDKRQGGQRSGDESWRLSRKQVSRNGAQSLVACFKANGRFVLLGCWIGLILAFGGTARPDTPSLLFLRPASVLVTGAGLWTLGQNHILRLKGAFALVLAIICLIGLHLAPLPPAWWSALPGRGLIVEIDKAVGLWGTWRPLSMSPPWTWHALWFMFTPLSVLVHAAQLSTRDVRRLGVVILVVGLAGGILAIAQMAGDPSGPLYFYRFTHFGTAVGLFANRNHQAVFLATLLPIALVLLRNNPVSIRLDQKSEKRLDLTNVSVIALIAGLVPLVLATGSRSGLAILVVSLLISLMVLPPFKTGGDGKVMPRQAALWTGLVLVAGLAIAGLALRNDRAMSIDRLVELDPQQDMRNSVRPVVVKMIGIYTPFGSGIGTFEPVFQIHEPDELLSPTYRNHVHNDWLEVPLTAGIPGVLLLGWGAVAWTRGVWLCVRRTTRQTRPDHDLAIVGLVVTLLSALASLSDYPLRTPSFAALLAVMLVWINLGLSKVASYHMQDISTSGDVGRERAVTFSIRADRNAPNERASFVHEGHNNEN